MNAKLLKKIDELLQRIDKETAEQVEPATPQLPPIPPEITEEIFQCPVGFFSQLIVDCREREVMVFISPPPSGLFEIFRDC